VARIRALHDPDAGKVWSSHCDGAVVRVGSGVPGRERHSDKPQPDAGKAIAYAMKEEWARLKKGFVLTDPAAPPGEPRMHRFLGRGGYTGALVAAGVDGRLLCNRYDDAEQRDRLLLVDPAARITDSGHVPDGLAWKAQYLPGTRRLLVLVDHRVLSGSVPLGGFEPLTDEPAHPNSFLSTAGTYAAWYAGGHVVVNDLVTGEDVFRQAASPELYGGHSRQMEGALSADGTTLAYSVRAGEVVLIDLPDGRVRDRWTGDFGMTAKLVFGPDGRHLIAGERYGAWRWRCYDLDRSAERADWPLLDSARSDLAVEPAGARFAVTRGDQVQVFDLGTLHCVRQFRLDHVVRTCAIAWLDDGIGVVTDYGCASMYALDSVR
jgi:hypothetical protein